MMTDMIDQPIVVGDFVAFYSNVYEVIKLGKPVEGRGYVRILICDASSSSRALSKYSKHMVVINKEATLKWLQGPTA